MHDGDDGVANGSNLVGGVFDARATWQGEL